MGEVKNQIMRLQEYDKQVAQNTHQNQDPNCVVNKNDARCQEQNQAKNFIAHRHFLSQVSTSLSRIKVEASLSIMAIGVNSTETESTDAQRIRIYDVQLSTCTMGSRQSTLAIPQTSWGIRRISNKANCTAL